MQNLPSTDEYSVILVTCETIDEAKNIAKSLVTERLAACVSIIPEIISTYYWNNDLQQHTEAQLFIKTISSHFAKIKNRVMELHSADVPEIIELKITNALDQYKMWISKETTQNIL